MKKLLLLVFLAGLAWTTGSCVKKEKCPEPEVWAVGTWKVSKIVDNGQVVDLTTSPGSCKAQGTIRLDDNHTGEWNYFYVSGGNCTVQVYPVDAWSENLKKNEIYITGPFYIFGIQYTFKGLYLNDHTFRLPYSNNSYMEFTKQ